MKNNEIQLKSDLIFGNYSFIKLTQTKPKKKGIFYCRIHNCKSSQTLSKHFLGRHCCPQCITIKRRSSKMTSADNIIKILKEKKIPFDYKGRVEDNKLSFHCKKHDIDFQQNISSFKKGSIACKECYKETKKSPSNKLSDINIKDRVSIKHPLITFIKRDLLDYRRGFFNCKKHGAIEDSKPISSIISSGRNPCKECVSLKKKKPLKLTSKYIQQKLDENGHGIIFLNIKDPLNSRKGYFLCSKHGKIKASKHLGYQMRIKNPMSCCEKCRGESISEFHGTKLSDNDIQVLSNESFGFFKYLRRDKDDVKKVFFLCTKHPYKGEHNQNLQNHFRGHNPCCNEQSKTEEKINHFLESLNINFETQKKFKECKHINPLAFDFYIEESNLLIEYDGRQHYKSIEYFGGEKSLNEIKLRDNIKNEFAKRKDFNFIRIPYTIKKEVLNIISEAISSINNGEKVFSIYSL